MTSRLKQLGDLGRGVRLAFVGRKVLNDGLLGNTFLKGFPCVLP